MSDGDLVYDIYADEWVKELPEYHDCPLCGEGGWPVGVECRKVKKAREEGRLPKRPLPKHTCMDCSWHGADPGDNPDYCKHFLPAHWEAQGFTEYWGDASVMMWPKLTIMRRVQGDKAEYVILAPDSGMRRPVMLWGNLPSWGSF